MPHAHVSRPSSLTRALVQALVFTLLPLGTAFAQSYPSVRVVREGTEISSLRGTKSVRMSAPKGTVLEVTFVDGDRYQHRKSNWYWVLLPTDRVGTRPAGWIRGDAVEHVLPPPESTAHLTPAAEASATEAPPAAPVRNEPGRMAVAEPAPVEEVAAARPFIADVVVNFHFDRSDLTEEAKRTLAGAVANPRTTAQGLSIALEGHADWTGPEMYNERLGLARAEAVRRFLAEQFRIPAGQIRVVSYGENSPAASNATREGRAQNRRVVIKVGA